MATQISINSLVPEVIDALQGRTDIADIAPRYIKRAVQELTENYPFPDLERTGSVVSLTAGQSNYPITMFLNGDDDYTFPNSFVVYIDYPTDTVKGVIRYRTPKSIEEMTSAVTLGIPSKFTRYGREFLLGPVPDNPYSVFLRYQVRHPFPADISPSGLGAAPLYIPDTWEEIVVYSAAMRIAVVKRWNEQRQELHDLLFGDPEFITSEGKRGQPGLISARMNQQSRDEKFDSRQLMPTMPRYNPR